MKRILIVEDEEPLQKAISIKLSKGFNMEYAKSANEAIDRLREEEFDAIWLDHYLLGKKTGIKVMEHINSNEIKSKVFVVSNTATKDKIENYKRLGIEKYFVKAGSTLDEIITQIKKYII